MTTNASLSDELMGQLQGAPMQGLAQQLGLDSVQTEQAVGVALPMLFGALGQNAAQPQGAADLFGALQRDHSSAQGAMDLGGLLGGLLGGAGGAGAAGGLGSILGSSGAPGAAARVNKIGVSNKWLYERMRDSRPVVGERGRMY